MTTGPEPDYIGNFLANRIEFDDDEDRPLTWLLLGRPSGSPTNDELRVRTFVSGAAALARLRVYRLPRLVTEIPFEFCDVPSP